MTDPLTALLRDVERDGAPSFEWVVAHAPTGDCRAVWQASPDAFTKLCIRARVGARAPLVDALVAAGRAVAATLDATDAARAGAMFDALQAYRAAPAVATWDGVIATQEAYVPTVNLATPDARSLPLLAAYAATGIESALPQGERFAYPLADSVFGQAPRHLPPAAASHLRARWAWLAAYPGMDALYRTAP